MGDNGVEQSGGIGLGAVGGIDSSTIGDVTGRDKNIYYPPDLSHLADIVRHLVDRDSVNDAKSVAVIRGLEEVRGALVEVRGTLTEMRDTMHDTVEGVANLHRSVEVQHQTTKLTLLAIVVLSGLALLLLGSVFALALL